MLRISFVEPRETPFGNITESGIDPSSGLRMCKKNLKSADPASACNGSCCDSCSIMTENRARPKITNPGRNVVRESLEGLVALNPGLRILENENSVFRHDFRQHVAAGKVSLLLILAEIDVRPKNSKTERIKTLLSQVCVVSGGGSGHEPTFGGLVGGGMLTAAVAGQVFTSPPPGQILNTLRKLASAAPQGAKHGERRLH